MSQKHKTKPWSALLSCYLLLPLTVVECAIEPKRSGSPVSFSSQYWTAFLNISYADQANNVWHTERTETGRFSSSGVREASGVAVEMLSSILNGDQGFDNTGCSPPFQANYPPSESWIAVIKRGKCTFNQKIANALRLNASGVLIYDSEDGGILQSMKVEKFPIPSVFTYHWKGKEILNYTKAIEKVYVSLQEGSHCRTTQMSENASKILYCTPTDPWDDIESMLKKTSNNPFWNWNGTRDTDSFNVEKRTSVLFVSVSFIVLMIISLAWLIFYYVQRFRYMHAKDQLERKLCSQAKRALSIISTSVLKKDDLEMKDFSETCAVCIETYRVADVVRILPCKHQFHKSCIDQWLLEKRTCPMCKMDILKHYGMGDDSSSSHSDREDSIINLA